MEDAAGTNITDGREDHNIGYEAPKTEIMRSSCKSRSGEKGLGQGT